MLILSFWDGFKTEEIDRFRTRHRRARVGRRATTRYNRAEADGIKQKNLTPKYIEVRLKKVASTYSPTLKRAVPSAQVGLTSLFEMVRGGPNRHRHPKFSSLAWFFTTVKRVGLYHSPKVGTV